MIRVGSQMTVKVLKEGKVVDLMVVYGLAVNYEKRSGSLHKLSVDIRVPSAVIDIIVEKITHMGL